MKHVLIVEDQPSGRFILSRAFKRSGYSVTAVENGQEAIEVIENSENSTNGEVDLVLTDIEMPKMSGPEMMDAFIDKKIDVPVIVMTAYGTKNLVVDLMRKGCSEYIEKPYEPFEVVLCVDRVLEKESKIKSEKAKQQQEELKERKKLESMLDTYRLRFDEMRREMDSAKDVYQNLVDINKDDLDIKVAYKLQPLSDLGGDFIDIKKTLRGCDVIIADVAGHDLSASFHTVLIKTLFSENAQQGKSGVEFFRNLNHLLLEDETNGRMITALFMSFDLIENTCEVVAAGHPYPIKTEKKYPVARPIIVEGDILGIHRDVRHKPHTFGLAEGQKLFLHTDGFTDMARVDGKTGEKQKLGGEGVDQLIQKYAKLNVEEAIDNIWKDACDFCKYKFKDDISILGIEIPILK